jgi:hypothetical protein
MAARDRRTFRRLGLCSDSPADSPNQVHLQSNCCTATDHRNIKCLDFTPIFPPKKNYLKEAFEIDLNWRMAALEDEDLKLL